MKQILLVFPVLSMLFFGCSNDKASSSSEINDLCSCMKETDYYEILNSVDFEKMEDRKYLREIDKKMQGVTPDSKENLTAIKCIAKNVKSLLAKYNDLTDDKEKGKFIRSIMTEMINNECVAALMDRIPYGKLEKELEKNSNNMSLKDMMKFLDKIESAKNFKDIEKEVDKIASTYVDTPQVDMPNDNPNSSDSSMDYNNELNDYPMD